MERPLLRQYLRNIRPYTEERVRVDEFFSHSLRTPKCRQRLVQFTRKVLCKSKVVEQYGDVRFDVRLLGESQPLGEMFDRLGGL